MNDAHPYSGLRPAELWRHFAALNDIPRPSGQEDAARRYVQSVAEAAGLPWKQDERGNCVVYVPPTVEGEAPPVAIQAHLDMVCQQRPNVAHDWSRDPVRPRREDDRIVADGTTLGADNGIGAAAALALITTPELCHGPLELLFTVEEETGLHGAMALDPTMVAARRMINLDSEDPDELTVGCAGGVTTTLRLPVSTEPAPSGGVGYTITVGGLKGGHSGVQIHQRLGNAIKMLAIVLQECREVGVEYFLADIEGGTAHNAIPRDASALVVVAPAASRALDATVAGISDILCREWCRDEPNLQLAVSDAATPPQVLTAGATQTLLHLLGALPHGVLRWSDEFAGKVETSSNLAELRTLPGEARISTSSRSFRESELAATQQKIRAIAELAGAMADAQDGYPGWEPNPNSTMLQLARDAYAKIHDEPAKVEVVHAGLECGVLAARLPGLDAVSFGPLIGGAHSPDEYVEISSVEKTWQLLTTLLDDLCARSEPRMNTDGHG